MELSFYAADGRPGVSVIPVFFAFGPRWSALSEQKIEGGHIGWKRNLEFFERMDCFAV
jgi:hypothetical protein